LGPPFRVAAEVYDQQLQFELVASGAGVGVMLERSVQRFPRRNDVVVVEHSLDIPSTYSVMMARSVVGSNMVAVTDTLETEIRATFVP
jgi:DNA-binding transcriptional LysR family regulator